MMRVTVDQATLERLHGLKEPLELYDESGRVLGRFTPASDGPGASRGPEAGATPEAKMDLNVFGREDDLK